MRISICALAGQIKKYVVLFRKEERKNSSCRCRRKLYIYKEKREGRLYTYSKEKSIVQWDDDDDVAQHMYRCVCVYMRVFVWQSCSLGSIEMT